MIKKLASHLGEYRRAALLTPMFSALEAVMDILLPTIMAFIIDLGIEKGDMTPSSNTACSPSQWRPSPCCWAFWPASTPPRRPPALPQPA